jgi:catechol 2,3-dioxygenase-like lactoylglutathione lyase family enzyme
MSTMPSQSRGIRNRKNIDEGNMLNDKAALATLPVKNIDVARKFYESTVGLTPVSTEEPRVVGSRSGNSTVLVYESQYAGTNKGTAATWVVGDEVDDVVRALKAKGVKFEHYDLPDTTRNGDVHVSGRTRVAWFKDPDGNILSLVNG